MAHFKIKKIGNHWYPDLEHEDPNDIILEEKVELFLSAFAKIFQKDEIIVVLEEVPLITEESSLIYFDESDITRYYTTSDQFNLRFEVDGREFEISDYLFEVILEKFRINLYEAMYKISLW